MADLSVNLCGIKLKNPIVASSGEPTYDYKSMVKAIKAGAGGVVAKSFAFCKDLHKSQMHPRWAILDENHRLCKRGKVSSTFSFYGRGGIPLEAPDWIDTLKKVKEVADKNQAVLIGSIATGPLDKMADAAKRMQDAGIQIIELDAGCPQVSQLGLVDDSMELVKATDIAAIITEKVVEAVDVPIIYKVAAETENILETCRAVKNAGAKAVTLINRHVGFAVDIEKGEPHLMSKAGIGGPWMLPLSLRWVAECYQADPDLTICGSNGACDWEDAVQFLMSGATIVQMCTAIIVNGYGVITDTVNKLGEFMDRKGYNSVEEIIGMAARKAKSYQELFSDTKRAVIDESLCSKCHKCLSACFYDGLTVKDKAVLVTEKCRGCGLCVLACPKEAIKLA